MGNQRKFYRCEICGNLVGLIEDGGGKLVCCGRDMTLILPNTEDASQEKHVPVVRRENGKLFVDVGSVLHPMIPEHHIKWIAVAQGNKTIRVSLDVTDAPSASFCVNDGAFTAYAYCNIHGLWMCEF